MDNGASSYRRYLGGDDDGLADLIRTYRDGLIFYLNGFMNDIGRAEELAEDVFIKIAVKKPHFKGKSSFKTWLYAIGRNEAISALRRNKLVYLPLDEAQAATAADGLPELRFFEKERKRALHRCLGRLKSEYHQALWLYYFEDLSVKEIASVMKRSAGSVDTLLYRARIALKRELRKEGIDDENL